MQTTKQKAPRKAAKPARKMGRRGIQPGQVAGDGLSRSMDKKCKDLTAKVLTTLKAKYGDRLRLQKKLTNDQIPGGVGACEPDGAAWFWDGKLIAAFEAKKQQNRGNAIERWYKNNYICRKLNPSMSYVTFVCGEGAVVGGVIHKALAVAHLPGFNVYTPGDNSCWMNPAGFTDEEVERIMLEVLEERITSSGSK